LDIRNYEDFKNHVFSVNPQIIFHLAAQPLVRYAYQFPVETYATNLMGTVHLLNIMKKLPNKCAGIFVTTDKCYENKEWIHAYRENDNVGGDDPYSSSKGCCEIAINSFRKSYFGNPLDCGKAVASVRAGNVIGGGDWSVDRIIPDCIRHLQKNVAIPVRNKNALRPWQHVLEPLSGYLQLGLELWENLNDNSPNQGGRLLELAEAYNFGPELYSNSSVEVLVTELLKHYTGRWIDTTQSNAVHEASLLSLSIDKAYHKLGWKPKWNLERSVFETASWYQFAEENQKEVAAFTQNQIIKYIKNE